MTDRTHSVLAAQLVVLRRRWPIAAIAGVVVLALVWPFALGLPALYRAGATILVEETAPGGLTTLADSGEIDQRLQAIKQEAVSRARLKELVARTQPGSATATGWNAAIAALQRDIRLEIVSTTTSTRTGMPSTVAFKVTYVGRDPATVANVANTVAAFYVAQNDALRSRAVSDTASNLRQALADATRALAAQQQRVAAFTRGDSGSLPQQSDSNQAALIRLTADLQSNVVEQTRLLERRQQVRDRLLELQTNPPADAEPELRLARLRKELADLRLHETENGPNVRAKQLEISALAQQVAAAGGRAGGGSRVTALESELAAIESRLRQLAGDRERLRESEAVYQRRLERSPERGTQLLALMHDYNTARETHESLQKRYDEAQMAERAQRGEGRTEFRILDSALPPATPSGPNRPLLLLGGLVAALVVGVALAFVVDVFDTSFHDIDDLRAFTRVPVLATIPQIVSAEDAARRRSVAGLVLVSTAIVVLGIGAAAFLLARDSDQIALLFLRRT